MQIELVEFAQACNRLFIASALDISDERARAANIEYGTALGRLSAAGYGTQDAEVDEAFRYVRETGQRYG